MKAFYVLPALTALLTLSAACGNGTPGNNPGTQANPIIANNSIYGTWQTIAPSIPQSVPGVTREDRISLRIDPTTLSAVNHCTLMANDLPVLSTSISISSRIQISAQQLVILDPTRNVAPMTYGINCTVSTNYNALNFQVMGNQMILTDPNHPETALTFTRIAQ